MTKPKSWAMYVLLHIRIILNFFCFTSVSDMFQTVYRVDELVQKENTTRKEQMQTVSKRTKELEDKFQLLTDEMQNLKVRMRIE